MAEVVKRPNVSHGYNFQKDCHDTVGHLKGYASEGPRTQISPILSDCSELESGATMRTSIPGKGRPFPTRMQRSASSVGSVSSFF